MIRQGFITRKERLIAGFCTLFELAALKQPKPDLNDACKGTKTSLPVEDVKSSCLIPSTHSNSSSTDEHSPNTKFVNKTQFQANSIFLSFQSGTLGLEYQWPLPGHQT